MCTTPVIARKIEVSQGYVDQIISLMLKSKIVRSFRGKSGGFALSKDPDKISLLEIIESIDGKIILFGDSRKEKKIAAPGKFPCDLAWDHLSQGIRDKAENITIGSMIEKHNRDTRINTSSSKRPVFNSYSLGKIFFTHFCNLLLYQISISLGIN